MDINNIDGASECEVVRQMICCWSETRSVTYTEKTGVLQSINSLYGSIAKVYIRYFFSFRVISKWNMLDDTTVTVKTANSFKTKLEMDRKMKMGLFLD